MNSVSAKGLYEKSSVAPNELTDTPVCHYAPAIILRKRTQKSLLAVFKKIAKDFESGLESSPVMSVALTGESINPNSPPDSDETGHPKLPPIPNGQAEEIYFPLLSNDKQNEIVRKLKGRPGVLVQGPPGTGKSHTIANLILSSALERVQDQSRSQSIGSFKEKFERIVTSLRMSLFDDSTAMELLEELFRDYDKI